MRSVQHLIVALLVVGVAACDLTDSPAPREEGRFVSICPAGCAHPSLASALEEAVDGDTLGIQAPVLFASGLRINHDILLMGILDGGGAPIIAGAPDHAIDEPILTVTVRASVVIENVIVERGKPGIVNDGDVRIRGASIRHNPAGGVRNTGKMWIDESDIIHNAGRDGAGIHNQGVLEISRSTVAFNVSDRSRGAGIFNDVGGSLTVTLSRITNNEMQVAGVGGGLSNAGTARVIESDIIANASRNGGGIFNVGTLDVIAAAVDSNGALGAGGGIYNDGILRIGRSSISRNRSRSGGGIFNAAAAELETSTISSNTVWDIASGGGIFSADMAQTYLENVTLTNNRSLGLWGRGAGIGGTGIVRFSNSILAGNFVERADADTPSDCDNTSGHTASLGYNMLGMKGGCSGGEAGDVFIPERNTYVLGPLGYYDGPTLVHPLITASSHSGNPAIDGGFCQTGTDQRGFPRPVDLPEYSNAANACDIGAFERQPFE